MSKKLGQDYRLWIESATPGTYNMILGNQDLQVTRSGSSIDTTSKDDYPYSTEAPGTRALKVTASFIPNLPDATGYTRLETQALSTGLTAVNFQIRKNGSAGLGTDVVLQGAFYITDFNHKFGKNDAVTADCTLVAAAAPTTDLLA